MYTSGCPKNQKRCWYNNRSPPPTGSKKLVLKFLSKNNIVMAAASTGSAKTNKKDVTKTDQIYNGKLCSLIDSCLKKSIVHIKLIDDRIEDTPTRCKLTITKSIDIWGCPIVEDNGGYRVHPVPGPPLQKGDIRRRVKDGGSNQKLRLLSLGKAISGAPINKGIKKLPKPPNKIGIITKNNISIPCMVTRTL